MPAKNNPRKLDYLKLTAIVLFLVVLATNIYVWWSPGDLLNTLSTTATMFGSSLLVPLGVLAVVFWIFMLVDSWQKNRLIWSLFILLGPGVIALLYFLIQKPKLPRSVFRPVAWVAVALFIVTSIPFTYAQLVYLIHPFDASKLQPTGRQVVATIITKDLQGYRYEGETICHETTLDNKYYLTLTGGEIVVPKDPTLGLNDYFSANSGGRYYDLGGGWQSFEGQPEPIQNIYVPNLIGSPTEISKDLTSCQVKLWSSKVKNG